MKTLLNWNAVLYALEPIVQALCTAVVAILAFVLAVFTLVWLPTVMGGITMPDAWHTRVALTGYILYSAILLGWLMLRYRSAC